MTEVHADQALAQQLADQIPGFWSYFALRHPKFGAVAPAGPIGWLPAGEVYQAIGETITAYVAEFGPTPKETSANG